MYRRYFENIIKKEVLKLKTSFLAQKERFESYAFAAPVLYILAPLLRKPSQMD